MLGKNCGLKLGKLNCKVGQNCGIRVRTGKMDNQYQLKKSNNQIMGHLQVCFCLSIMSSETDGEIELSWTNRKQLHGIRKFNSISF